MAVSKGLLEGAAKGNPQLLAVLTQILGWQGNLSLALGIDPLPSQQSDGNTLDPPPKVAGFDVQGQDGKFKVNITPADGTNGPIYYLIESSETVPFKTSTTVSQYGPTNGTSFDITDPNVVKYWRVRSRYGSSDYGSPVHFTGGVDSGTLASTSNAPLNSTFAAVDGLPSLIQGVDSDNNPNTTIDIQPTSFQMGTGVQISYNSGLLDVGSFGLWHVYANDPKRLGGTVVYQASKSLEDVAESDGNIYFGFIVLRSDACAVGSATGSGVCPATGSLILKSNGSLETVESLKSGDSVLSIDGGVDNLNTDPVSISGIPCIQFTTQAGLTIQAVSVDHLTMSGNGGFVRAANIFVGDAVTCRFNNQNVTDYIASKTFVGFKTVYKLSLSRTKTFNCDGLWSHNKDDYDFSVGNIQDGHLL